MGSPIADNWIYATVKLENEFGGTGTGFLVARLFSPDRGKVFVVTNKHVVHEEPAVRGRATRMGCSFNTREADGQIGMLTVDVPLRLPDGTVSWCEHPDVDTDVLAFDATQVVTSNANLHARWVTYNDFALAEKIAELEITVAEEVLVIGYPLGFKQGGSNLPLVRQGLLATGLGRRVEDTIQDATGVRNRSMPGFLFDGAAIPGSSGSPVILKPVIGRLMKGGIHLEVAPPVLLGIVAETRYAPIRQATGVVHGFAGLGLAFDAQTVKDTIELFFPNG